jgi:hypothetical protein
LVISVLIISVAAILAVQYSNHPPIYDPPTPVGAMPAGSNVSGSWVFNLVAISQTNVRITDCAVSLTIDDHRSDAYAFIASSSLNIPIDSGNATGYSLRVNDVGKQGYLSEGDDFIIGPINNATGNNAYQPSGTQVTFHLIYNPSGGQIVEGKLTVQ